MIRLDRAENSHAADMAASDNHFDHVCISLLPAAARGLDFAQNRPKLNPGMVRAVREVNRAACAGVARVAGVTGAKKKGEPPRETRPD